MTDSPRHRFALNLPRSLKEQAAALADADGVSLNQWITTAVAYRVGSEVTADAFFAKLRAETNPQTLLDALRRPVPMPASASRSAARR